MHSCMWAAGRAQHLTMGPQRTPRHARQQTGSRRRAPQRAQQRRCWRCPPARQQAGWGSPARPAPPAIAMTGRRLQERGRHLPAYCPMGPHHVHREGPSSWTAQQSKCRGRCCPPTPGSCLEAAGSQTRRTWPSSSSPRQTAYWRRPTKPRVPSMGSSTQCCPCVRHPVSTAEHPDTVPHVVMLQLQHGCTGLPLMQHDHGVPAAAS